MARVSVILPCCNSQQWIAESVQSVLGQTHQDIELIVIDDASTDNTLKLLDGFASDPRLNVIKSAQTSGGPATPRNLGIEAATGEYLAFIDSDDIWHPDKLKLQIQALEQHQLNFLSTEHIRFKYASPTTNTIDESILSVQRKSHQQLLKKNWVVTSSALMSKCLLDDLSFDQSTKYIGIEDYIVWLQVHQRSDIKSAILKAPLVFYRVREDSISYSKRAMAAKIFHLLSDYRIGNKPLGLKKYYYFACYAASSIMARLT